MYTGLKKYAILGTLFIIAGFLIYSHFITKELEKEAEIISRVYGRYCSQITQDETTVIFDEIISKINFPVIVTSPDGEIISSRNVKTPSKEMIAKLNKQHKPIKIEYEGKTLAYVHYGRSTIRNILKIAPILEITLGIVIILIGVIWLYSIKRAEENAIFAGIAKETAHQLGTPISALLGWKELIKDNNIKNLVEEDIKRLEEVARRFHKIGCPPKFEIIDIDKAIKPAIEYLKERIPERIKIIENYNNSYKTNIDKDLFFWAIENLIKNSIDAESTEIKITTTAENKKIKILIEDNGKGIDKKLRKKIFLPGFTTKEYGWGIGLSLVKRIIGMHYGKIFYKPNKPRGSSFIILLPIK